VAGVAALYLQNNTTATPATVRAIIVDSAWVNKLSGIGTGSPNRLLNSLLRMPPPPTNSLTVSVTCIDTGALYSTHRFDCTAQASGGSGTGYSFIWQGNASEYYDNGGTSKAWYPCQYVSGSNGYGYLSATAVAFDSNGSYKGATYNKQPC
jgi:hypothetical protein